MEKLLDLQPGNPDILNKLAQMLVYAPESSLRNGPRALELALKASQVSDGNDPGVLDTLAAAYTETGQFTVAAQTARKAATLAGTQSNLKLIDALRQEIKLYEAGRQPEEGHGVR